ncbi:MAG: cysteine rich repeat-containing protein [Bdellovibrionia bacterium]
MKPILLALAIASFGMVSVSPSHAAANSNQQPKLKNLMANVKEKCGSDIKTYCGDVTPGQGRIAACLKSKEDKLSESCRTAYQGTVDDVSKRMDRAEVAFRKQCGNDVQKFCADTPSGQGRIWSCLDQHKSDLSKSCKNFQTKVEQKVDEYLG